MGRKADLQQAGGGGLVRFALTRHAEVELLARGVEQHHGGALGVEELPRPAGRIAQQLVEVREGREAARDLVEQVQAVVLSTHRGSAAFPSVGRQRKATSAAGRPASRAGPSARIPDGSRRPYPATPVYASAPRATMRSPNRPLYPLQRCNRESS